MEVQEKHRFDEQRLARFMSDKVAGFVPPLRVEQFKGGQSNPTYLVTGKNGRLVLRAKPGPAAKLLPSAHAVEREFRVITALGKGGFPVPRTHFLCEDEGVTGRAFYVMDYVEGRVLWDPALPGMTQQERAAIWVDVPAQEWANLPRDLSGNLDHYIYGAAKK